MNRAERRRQERAKSSASVVHGVCRRCSKRTHLYPQWRGCDRCSVEGWQVTSFLLNIFGGLKDVTQ